MMMCVWRMWRVHSRFIHALWRVSCVRARGGWRAGRDTEGCTLSSRVVGVCGRELVCRGLELGRVALSLLSACV